MGLGPQLVPPGPRCRALHLLRPRPAITEAASLSFAPSPSLPCPRPRSGGGRHPPSTMALKRIHKVSGRRSAVGWGRWASQLSSRLRPALPAVASAGLAASSDTATGEGLAGRPSHPAPCDGARGGPGAHPALRPEGRSSAQRSSPASFPGSAWCGAPGSLSGPGLLRWRVIVRAARRGCWSWGVGEPRRPRSKALAPSWPVLCPTLLLAPSAEPPELGAGTSDGPTEPFCPTHSIP